MAGNLPLSYCLSINFNEARKFCTVENILNVRAILSWNMEPTPGDENFNPVWGNVLNARVQVAPFLLHKVPIPTLISEGMVNLHPPTPAALTLTHTLSSN